VAKNKKSATEAPAETPEERLIREFELPSSKFDADLDSDPTEVDEPSTAPPRGAVDQGRNPDGTFKPKTYQHSGLLLKQATDAGLTLDQARETPAEDLRTYIQGQQFTRFNSQRETSSVTMPRASEVEDEEVAIAWDKHPLTGKPMTNEDGSPMTEADYDPLFVHLRKDYEQFKAAVIKRLGGVESHLTQQGNREALSQADQFFSKYPEIYGTGATEDLDPNGPEAASRQSVFARMQAIPQTQRAKTTFKKELVNAHNVLHGRFVKKTTDDGELAPRPPVNRVAATLNGKGKHPTTEEWEEAGLVRPSHRDESELPRGEERAMRAVKEKLKTRRIVLDDEEDPGDRHHNNLPD
jgi:hypothetical protein